MVRTQPGGTSPIARPYQQKPFHDDHDSNGIRSRLSGRPGKETSETGRDHHEKPLGKTQIRVTMYCDKDSNGRVSIMDLTSAELDTIRRAIMAFKTGLLQNRLPDGFAPQSETYEQYHRAGMILRQIETLE
ncbi:MAG: hypothetical protein V8Q54_05605 [Alistipes senegalensis]